MELEQIDLANIDQSNLVNAMVKAKIIQMLDHPNIVKIYDIFKTKSNKLCIVKEHIDGSDIDKVIEKK